MVAQTSDDAVEVAAEFVPDLSYAEIVKIVSCPVGTVKSRMSYALRHLTTVLGNQAND